MVAEPQNLLRGDLPFPVAVIRESALAHNIRTMAEWTRAHGFALAPHGKTTMCPQIFKRQLDAGAWGITAATSTQAVVCFQAGARRVLIANQLIAPANIRELRAVVEARPGAEIYCLADSETGIAILDEHWSGAGVPMRVLLEFGWDGWRTGARSLAALHSLLGRLQKTGPHLQFAGIEAFEGSASDPAQAEAFLHSMTGIARQFPPISPLLFSAGGSAYLAVLARALRDLPEGWIPLLRSGCYVTHDHGIYEQRQAASAGMDSPQFHAALELWAVVQSRPEPALAILSFGKRNVSYDLGLPRPLDLPGCTITALNDQHAFMTVPPGVRAEIGDLVRLGISHPCTTFDKWRNLPLVDDEYNVLEDYKTYF
jgi:D-serine dehydratase